MRDFYQVLGISPSAEAEVIVAAYKAMMRKYHPDTSRGPDAVRRAQELNEAYETLRHPSRRAAYDATRGKQQTPRPSPPPPPPPYPPAAPAKSDKDREATRSRWGQTALGVLIAAALISAFVIGTTSETDSASAEDNTSESPGLNWESGEELSASSYETMPEDLVIGQEGNERVPTIGEFETKVATAVEDFVDVQQESGMIGAQTYSQDCHTAARRMNDIIEVDYCVAFDLAAWTLDRSLSSEFGIAPNEYFLEQVNSHQQEYSAFSQANPQRRNIIQVIVSEILPTALKRKVTG